MNIFNLNSTVRRSFFWNSIFIISLAIGLFSRFYSIGKWPFTDDEFYIIKSVENILIHGLPKFDCGGYYTRGLTYQYLSAGILLIFSSPELLLRTISTLFNVFSIPALFVLGKRIGGKSVAYMATILFAISVWEIEFSRFARMYTLFQFIFLIYFIALFRVLLDKNIYYEKYLYGLTILATFTYEGAVFLAILNFLPTFYFRRLNRLSNLIAPIIVFCFVYIFLSINFRRIGVVDFLPETFNIITVKNSRILFPFFLITNMDFKILSIFSFISLAIFYIWSIFFIFRNFNIDLFQKAFYFFIITTALFHQYGLLVSFAVVGLCLGYINLNKNYFSTPIFYAVLFIAISMLFWIITFFLEYPFPTLNYEGIKTFSIDFFATFFGYPDFFNIIFYQWYKVFPNLFILSTFLGFICFIYLLSKRNYNENAFFLLIATFAIILIIVGVLNTHYRSSRYTFFVYPLVLLIVAKSIIEIPNLLKINIKLKECIIIFTFCTFTIASEDINLHHLLNIGTAEVNFRTIYSKRIANHYYNRYDYKTPAYYINSNRVENELVFTLFTPTSYYLNHLDYVYIDAETSPNRITAQASCKGTRELWSNAELVYNKENLFSLITESRYPVWIIAGNSDSNISNSLKSISTDIFRIYRTDIVSRSIDNAIFVYKIDPNKKEL